MGDWRHRRRTATAPPLDEAWHHSPLKTHIRAFEEVLRSRVSGGSPLRGEAARSYECGVVAECIDLDLYPARSDRTSRWVQSLRIRRW